MMDSELIDRSAFEFLATRFDGIRRVGIELDEDFGNILDVCFEFDTGEILAIYGWRGSDEDQFTGLSLVNSDDAEDTRRNHEWIDVTSRNMKITAEALAAAVERNKDKIARLLA